MARGRTTYVVLKPDVHELKRFLLEVVAFLDEYEQEQDEG